MKKQIGLFLAGAALVSLASCGGGWSEENKASMKETCTSLQSIIYPDDAAAICDCYVTKLVEQYPNADMTPDQSGAVLDECSADAKAKAEAESEAKMQQMLDDMENSMNEAGDSMEEQMEEMKN
ncbi:MAG: hypothetical protein R2809_02210 [Flavobacteriales bacterium]